MKISGKVWKFGADIDTDAIIPARYLNTSDPDELAKHCMEDANPDFMNKMKPGDIIIAGKNFGCGSSREHAPIAIKSAGVSCIIAVSFARIFYRNAFNTALPIFEAVDACEKMNEEDIIEVDTEKGNITNLTQKSNYSIKPIPPFMESLIKAGGLIKFVRNNLK